MASLAVRKLDAETLGELSPQLRRAARFVLDNPDEVATRSLRQVARAANLPPPTFSRLARAIGFDSYDALRETCRGNIGRRGRLADKALALVESRTEAPFLATHAAATIGNIESMLDGIDVTDLDDAARLLASAPRVVLIGSLSARAFMGYASYLAGLSQPGWRVMGQGGASMSSDLADLGERDAVLAMSFEPYAACTVDAARAAAARGTTAIAITDSPFSPLATLGGPCFLIPTDSPQFFPSHVTVLLFLEALIGMVVRESGADAQRRIAALEAQSHALREYWQDGPAAKTGRVR